MHQVQCGEGCFPLESFQVKSLSEPMVRPEKSHVGFWSGRESSLVIILDVYFPLSLKSGGKSSTTSLCFRTLRHIALFNQLQWVEALVVCLMRNSSDAKANPYPWGLWCLLRSPEGGKILISNFITILWSA